MSLQLLFPLFGLCLCGFALLAGIYMDKYREERRKVVKLQADLAEANARYNRLGIMFDTLAKVTGVNVKIDGKDGDAE